jgi:hypothetical protein
MGTPQLGAGDSPFTSAEAGKDSMTRALIVSLVLTVVVVILIACLARVADE